MALIAGFTVLNVLGLKTSAGVQIVLVAFVLAVMAVFLLAGLPQTNAGAGGFDPFFDAVAREQSPDILIFYHSDGDFTGLIPDLVDIGVNAINPVQPDCMDGAAIKRDFGDRLAIWGAVGSACLWDRGSPDHMRAEVRRCIKAMGPEGLLLAPAYDIDFAPFENIVAFVEAVDEFG